MYKACLLEEGSVIQIPDEGDQSGIIRSPGYPYIVPENTECRWTVQAPVGQVSYSDTVECIMARVIC